MELRTSEEELLAGAEAVLPRVLADLYADRLGSGSITEEEGRRFLLLDDSAGRRVELRLDTAGLPRPLAARTFTNTTTDRYVIQLADTLRPDQAGQVLAREVGELLSVRERAAVGGRAPLGNLLTASPALPDFPELSDADRGLIAEFNYLANQMNEAALSARERQDARALFSALVDDAGLRPVAPVGEGVRRADEQHAADMRMEIVLPELREDTYAAMAELAVPVERLNAADAAALAAARASRVARAQVPQALGEFPMPGLRPDGTPVPREELSQAADAAARERTELSGRTLAELRAQQVGLPEGRYPEFAIMIGGGAALAGRDPDVLLVDARGRWHVDPIRAIVQSADQVRHLRQSGLGDPYQFADPLGRVPLPALQLWEDTAAARGPLIDGRAELSVSAEGRLIAEIVPADGSAPVKVEVKGSPLVATGIPPEIIPGADRQVPTVREAADVLAQALEAAGAPEAAVARDRLLALPEGEGRAAAALEVLADPQVADVLSTSTDPRVGGASDTLRATAAWERASALAPGRVLMGDAIGDGEYDPSVAKDWVLAGVGGAAIANAEIILEADPQARVFMIGKDAPFVLHNDAQYTALRREHDAAWGGDGRLVTMNGLYLGAVGTVEAPDGRVRLTALDSAGAPVGVEGDAYVACLGRVSRLPHALDAVESAVRSAGGEVSGELLFDADRQYLGYRLKFEANELRHTVDVTGAASRMLPAHVFRRDDIEHLAAVDAKTAPPESGNVAPGFMATALQGSYLARHRAAERGPQDTPSTPQANGPKSPAGPDAPAAGAKHPEPAYPAASLAYPSAQDAVGGAEDVARSFQTWVGSDMGRQLAGSDHPRIRAFRDAWRQLPPNDLPAGPGAASAPYGEVAERVRAVATVAVAAGRFAREDIAALHTLAQAAETHSTRLAATQPGPTTGQRGPATPHASAPAPRVATPPPTAPRSPRLAT
ncbi:hypothetical protein [Streptomyces sp. NBC_01565]|uniref:hypothetical protein n=1 Tax=unclassified Streptomyces TaxID=2593676 RepID=UPI002259B133|nr:hypothetical protein [Streptomyces sp. NBC_01565]MCX4545802.1 hypothetical protein [Streptomyces sp. NBC_01565]